MQQERRWSGRKATPLNANRQRNGIKADEKRRRSTPMNSCQRSALSGVGEALRGV
jgi:hypothetical protein